MNHAMPWLRINLISLITLLACGVGGVNAYFSESDSTTCIEYGLCEPGQDTLDLTIFIPTGYTANSYHSCKEIFPTLPFFSEYIEGSSNNKCVEIFNGSKDTIDLVSENYKIEFYRNGNIAGNPSIALSGMLYPDSVFVFCDDASDQSFLVFADQDTNSIFYNGDDAVALLRGADTLDVIGRIGEDPGVRWGNTMLGTQNLTLIRKSSIVVGDTISSDPFDPSVEWEALPQDDISNLGLHNVSIQYDCNPIVSTVDFVPTLDSVVLIVVEDAMMDEDSIIISFVNSNSASFFQQEEICLGDSVLFGSQFLKTQGVYRDTISSPLLCDSIIELTLVVLDTFRIITDSTICLGDSVEFGGLFYKDEGTYIQSLSTTGMCDSTLVLNLTVLPIIETIINDTICTGDTYDFGGELIDVAGQYMDTIAAANTCDSIVILNLSLRAPLELSPVDVVLCSNEADSVDLRDYNKDVGSLSYSYSYQQVSLGFAKQVFISEYMEGSSNNKCVEIYNGTASSVDLDAGGYQLQFYFNGDQIPNSDISLTGVLQSGDVYVICDEDIDSSLGVVPDLSSSATFYNGDDAIVLLGGGDTLDVIGQIGVDPGMEWFDGSISFRNHTLRRRSEIIIGDTIGRDVFAPAPEWIEFAEDDVSGFGSHTIGTFYRRVDVDSVLYNVSEGDSIVITAECPLTGCLDMSYIVFDVSSNTFTSIHDSICRGDVYPFGGVDYFSGGIYRDTTISLGCDSIVELTLTVLDTFRVVVDSTICFGDSVDFGGVSYNSSGTYVQSLSTTAMCDSTVVLNLTVLPKIETVINDTICKGETYDFGGELLEIEGQYADTIPAANMCDSIIILNLSLRAPLELSPVEVALCSNETDSVDLRDYDVDIGSLSYDYSYQQVSPVLPNQVFISEYMEGSSNNKCIEIYNGTASSIDLSAGGYQLQFYNNGSPTSTFDIPLTGVLQSGDVFVICDEDVDVGLGVVPDLTSSVTFYNGDDAIVLLGGGDTLDVIGQIGIDPGTAWSDANVSFQDQTLRRRSEVIIGDTIGGDVFVPSTEWEEFAEDDVSGFGSHVIDTIYTRVAIDSVLYDVSDRDSIVVIAENPMTGCLDSTYIVFDVLGTAFTAISDSICLGDVYPFGGIDYMTAGIYRDSLKTTDACDSIIELTLVVLDTFRIITDSTICLGDSVEFGGLFYKDEGTYIQSLSTIGMCDSTLILNLTVLPIIETTINDTICIGDTYDFGGELIDVAGQYMDTIAATNTCDSIVILNLSLRAPLEFSPVEVSLCSNETDSVDLRDYNVDIGSLSYDYSYQQVSPVLPNQVFISEYMEGSSNNKCIEIYNGTASSIDLVEEGYQLQFYINGNQTSTSNISLTGVLQSGDVYVICDEDVDVGLGVVADLTSGVTFYNGNDAIALLGGGDTLDVIGQIGIDPGTAWSDANVSFQNQTLRRRSEVIIGDTIGGDVFVPSAEWEEFGRDDVSGLGSHAIDTAFVRTDIDSILYNIRDEDSIVVVGANPLTGCLDSTYIVFDVLPTAFTAISDSICLGDVYPFGGIDYMTAGIYRDSLKTTDACDSIIELRLVVLDTFRIITDSTICLGDSVEFCCLFYKDEGTYIQSLSTIGMCDSTLILNLTVLPIVETTINDTICIGDTYDFGGELIDVAGQYMDTIAAANTCDSIVILNLSLRTPLELSPVEVSLCSNETDSVDLRDYDVDIGSLSYDYSYQQVSPVLPNQVFISEYMEGSSNNKCIEIYNGTGSSIDLVEGGYQLQFYINGNQTSTSNISLTGVLQSGDVYVICDEDVDVGLGVVADLTSGVTFYNGNDAIALLGGGDTLDVIGQIGVDPGTAWSDANVSFQNQTLRRRSEVIIGDTIGGDVFVPSTEWEEFAQNNVSGLGSHAIDTVFVRTDIDSIFYNIRDVDSIVVVGANPLTGCLDSTCIVFDVLPTAFTAISDSICLGDVYPFGGIDYMSAGIYRDSLKTTDACDSIIELTLVVLDTFRIITDSTICLGDSVEFGGLFYKDEGSYIQSLSTIGMCDSTLILNLTVLPIIETTINDTICIGETYDFGGELLEIEGQYADTIPAANMCDSIIILNLSLRDSLDLNPVEVSLCSNETDSVDLRDYDMDIGSLSYDYSYQQVSPVLPNQVFISEYMEGSSNNKCIEIYNGTSSNIDLSAGGYQLQFYINGNLTSSSNISLTGVIQSGDVYVVCDEDVDVGLGVAADLTSGVTFYNGNDGIALLGGKDTLDVIGQIGVDPGTAWSDVNVSFQNQTLRRRSEIIIGDTIGGDVFVPSAEWEEFARDDVSGLGSHAIDTAYIRTDIDSILYNIRDVDSIVVFGANPLTGCLDSTYIVFDVLPMAFTAISDSICLGDVYPFGGVDHMSGGIYRDSLKTTDACDSIIELTLTVFDTFRVVWDEIICSGDSIEFGGIYYKDEGTYIQSLSATGMCDSTVVLNLTVAPVIEVVINDTICIGDTYDFGGETLGVEGQYIDTIFVLDGCDSIISLNLHVIEPITILSQVDTLCDDRVVIDLTSYESQFIQAEGSFSYTEVSQVRGEDIFISEYIEGSGFNKCLELFNPTLEIIDLSAAGYVVELYRNGDSTPTAIITLSGQLDPDSVFVVCDDSSDSSLLDLSDQLITSSWNGDDAIVLRRDSVIIDVIGRVGEDPGSRWGSGAISTLDNTLIRLPSQIEGDSSRFDTYDPIVFWESKGIDFFDDLGVHTVQYDEVRSVVSMPTDYIFNSGEVRFEVDFQSDSTGCTSSTTLDLIHEDCSIPDTIDLALAFANNELPYKIDGDSIIYSITITNEGNQDLFDIIYGDMISSSVDDISQTLSSKYVIESLAASSDTTLVITSSLEENRVITSLFVVGGIISAESITDSLLFEDFDGLFSELDVNNDHNDILSFNRSTGLFVQAPIVENQLFCSDEQVPDLIAITPTARKNSDALFFSQYYEGRQLDKCLELYNNTGVQQNLSDYAIEVYSNGASTPSRILQLEGILEAGEVYIICNEDSRDELIEVADLVEARVMIFNGDDAIVLRESGVVVDVIGQVGFDPGTQWNAGGVNTRDVQLVRTSDIYEGDYNHLDAFDPSQEWFVIDTGDFSFFETHTSEPISIDRFNFYESVTDIPNNPILTDTSSYEFVLENGLQEVWVTSIDRGCESLPTRFLSAVQLDRRDLSCLADLRIIVGTDCSVAITSDQVLTGAFIPEFYEVEVFNNNVKVDIDDFIQFYTSDELTYRVRDSCSQLSCWGRLEIEYVPVLEIADCQCEYDPALSITPPECMRLCDSDIDTLRPIVRDACLDEEVRVPLQLRESDEWIGSSMYKYRYWMSKGDTICVQRYEIIPYNIDDLVMPQDSIIGECIDLGIASSLRETSNKLFPRIIFNNDTVVFYNAGSYCNFKIELEDLPFDSDCKNQSRLIRRWHVKDGDTGNSLEYIQRITSEDREPPSFDLESATEQGVPATSLLYEAVVMEQITCQADFYLPKILNLSDNCTAVEDIRVVYDLPEGVYKHDNQLRGLGLGVNRVRVTAYDNCDNSISRTMVIVVTDISDPFAICRDIEIPSLNIYLKGRAVIPLDVFDLGSWDACGQITTRIGRRLDNKLRCEGESLTFVSTRELEFCCEDIGKDIPISLTVFDASGNRDECTLIVKVRESEQFSVMNDTLHVECLESIDPNVIGYPVTNHLVCYQPRLSWVDSIILGDRCHPIEIERTWFDSSSMMSDVQVIYRDRSRSFHPVDIRWPLHYTGETIVDTWGENVEMYDPIICQANTIDSTYVPPFHCKLLGISYEDDVFDQGGRGCYEVVRSWSVIDWCTYDAQTSLATNESLDLVYDTIYQRYNFRYDSTVVVDGFYNMNQVLYYADTVAPIIHNCDDLLVESIDSNCSGQLISTIYTSDEGLCSSEELIVELVITYDDLEVLSRHWTQVVDSVVVTEMLPIGNYKLRWKVSDQCGNESTCNQLVSIESVRDPELICYSSIATTFNAEGEAEIWTNDVLKSIVGCGERRVYFKDSIEEMSSIKINCGDLSQEGVAIIELYAEANGLETSCNIEVEISNAGSCSTSNLRSTTRKNDKRLGHFKVVEIAPNPFELTTYIHIDTEVASEIDLVVYNAAGKKVYQAKQLVVSDGNIQVSNQDLGAAGIYYCHITDGTYSYHRKIILVR